MRPPLPTVLALLLLTPRCPAAAVPAASWPHAVTYEVFVRSFADSDGDGIGDLPGLIGKLDYLRDLGVQALWLMPINPSPSYHKYDVTDYRAIDPEYGTMADFENFIAEAKRRNLRVIIDLVVNHTSRDHPWFQAALADAKDPRFQYYVWRPEGEIDDPAVSETGPDTDNRRKWNPAEPHPGMLYYAYFTGGMPDLNHDNPEVRREIREIGRFWLQKGVDGFRLDAARHIFPEDRLADNVEFWRGFREAMREVNPDVLLVGEVWADSAETRAYLPGLGSAFNFELAGRMLEAIKKGRGGRLASWHADTLARYAESAPDFIDATFLTNHDQNRVASQLEDEDKARVAASLLLTLPGAPYLYYGEEIGMLGSKPDFAIREPMLWQREPDPDRTRSQRVRHSTDLTVQPVAEQEGNPASLLNHYRALIALRNATPALSVGSIEPVEGLDESLVVFVRRHADGNVLVLHNVSGERAALSLPENMRAFGKIRWASSDGVEFRDGRASLPPRSSLILQ